MIVSLLLASLSSVLVPSAHAETPPAPVISVTVVTPPVTGEAPYGVEVPTSQYGVSMVIGSDCSVAITGKNLSPAKAGKLVGEVETAKARCMAAKAGRDDKARLDLASSARSVSLDKLIVSAGQAGEKGIDVSVVTADTTVEMGDHLKWKSFGGAAMNGNGYVPGMPVGYVDPQMAMLYRLNAGMGAHPAIPGVVMPMQPIAQTPPSAQADNSGALGTCQDALRKVSDRLEACGKK